MAGRPSFYFEAHIMLDAISTTCKGKAPNTMRTKSIAADTAATF